MCVCVFLVPAHLGSPGKRTVKWVCVCVCVDVKLKQVCAGVTFWLFVAVL